MKQTLTKQWGLVLAIGISLIAYLGLLNMQWRFGTLRDSHVPETIGWFLTAFVAYIAALFWSEHRGISSRTIWIVAILFRVILLFTTPTLSDDVYRYLWDGYVANEGVSPYAYAIDSPELDYLDHPIRSQANNTWMASPYLPTAQWVFRGVTAVFPLTPLFLQITMTLFDLATAVLLSHLLKITNLPAHRLTIYLWNPLIIIEIAHSAHLDAWMLLLTLLATTFTIHHSPFTINKYLPPLLLSLATLTKLLPVLLLPLLFWHWNWRQRISYGIFTILLLIPSGIRAGWGITGVLDGTGLFGALRIYGNQWNFNSGIFHWIELILQKQGAGTPTNTAKLIVFAGLLGILTAVFLIARTKKTPSTTLRLAIIPFIAYVLLIPTLHPWYIIILLIFLPFLTPTATESKQRWLLITPWIYLSGALIFSYLTYLDPLNFGELEWVRNLEWIPTLGLLATAVLTLPSALHFPKCAAPQ
ncbi:MAG: hypothetical protein GY943_24645 [Chloroflexi bacterium]|nr:hypothetical protein [Chloroflexota bacterium]